MGDDARFVSRSSVYAPSAADTSIRPCMAAPLQGAKRFLSASGPRSRVDRPYSMVRINAPQVDFPDSLGAYSTFSPGDRVSSWCSSRPNVAVRCRISTAVSSFISLYYIIKSISHSA